MKKPKLYEKIFNIREITKVSLEKRIKRGEKSWGFIYRVFGVLLTIFIFIISILPLNLTHKGIVFILGLIFLIYLCLFNAWFQNKLIGFKIKLEEMWRKI